MIVTGCQRSGTATVARIFGLTHEKIFNPEKLNSETVESLIKTIGHGESSWLAAPYAKVLSTYTSVIHLVRHPLAVLNSLEGIGFWGTTDNNGHEPYREFIFKHLPDIITKDDVIEKSLYYWVEWNRILNKYPRIRIEDIVNAPKLNSRRRANYTMDAINNSSQVLTVKKLMREYYYE